MVSEFLGTRIEIGVRSLKGPYLNTFDPNSTQGKLSALKKTQQKINIQYGIMMNIHLSRWLVCAVHLSQHILAWGQRLDISISTPINHF